MKLAVIVGAAALVLLIARTARADTASAEYAADPRNWYWMRGTTPGGGVVM